MLLEPKQREEMANLASEVLRLTEGGIAQAGLVDVAHRLAELVSAVTACGDQGGKSTLIMACLRCNARIMVGKGHEEHVCAARR